MSKLNQTEWGHITLTDRESDKVFLSAKTLMCCHCGFHWIPSPGSGRLRGYCTRCMGPVSGPQCADCVPYAQRLCNSEAGLGFLAPFRPIAVSVPSLPPA